VAVGQANVLNSKQPVGSADAATASDEELVSAVVAGDRAAMAQLIRRYDQLLYRTARSILKDDTEAEDVVQEGFLLAYRGFANFRHDAKLSTWLIRIVVNVAAGRLRKTSRRPTVVQLSAHLRQKSQEGDRDAPERPDEAVSRAELRHLLEAKIDSLPDPYCVVFVLRGVQELSIEETSDALGIPKATVRSRFSRARRLLRQSLSKELHGALGDAFPFAGRRCDRMVSSIIAALDSA
jgi:RNA polymerase sigma-70 factor (ECF subfamily)